MLDLTKFKSFYNQIYKDYLKPEEMVYRISKSISPIAEDLHIAKIGISISIPSMFTNAMPFAKKGIFFERHFSDDSFITFTYTTTNDGNFTFTVYPEKKYIFSDSDKSDIDFLCQTIFTLLDRSQLYTTLKRIAEHDPLTGAYNKDGFIKVGNILSEKKFLSKCSVLYLDLKNFSNINRKYGLPIGDVVLRSYAQELFNFIGKAGFVGRLGGNFFAIIIKNAKLSQIIQFLEEVPIKIKSPDGAILQEKISAKIGLCACDKLIPFVEFLSRASIAMKNAKASPVQDLIIFEQSMMDNLDDKLTIKV